MPAAAPPSGSPVWRMPPEWAPHERTWMAWPSSGYTLGDSAAEADEARATWADVALAVSRFEPVTVVVDPAAVDVARRWLDEGRHGRHRVDLLEAPLDDAWMRDIGPTFVVSDAGVLGAVDWVFNGWGAQSWATWDADARIGDARGGPGGGGADRERPRQRGRRHPRRRPRHGAAHRDRPARPGPQPGPPAADVEAELARTIGATTCIWLPRGLTRDYDEFGTRGHVDIVATFASPGVVLLHWQGDPAHPDHEVSVELERPALVGARRPGRAARGGARARRRRRSRTTTGRSTGRYINHLVVNGGVVACTFDDPQDADVARRAREGVRRAAVVGVDARPLFDRGGGIHCITQQQPSA